MPMNIAVPEARRPQHSLSDWLNLHALDATTCHAVLDAIARGSASATEGHDRPKPPYQPLDLDTAWRRTVEALCDALPEQHGIIDATFANTQKIVLDRPGPSRKAVTLDNGRDAYPTILFSYRGAPAEHLVVAHEFGHALQIRASQGRLVPPIVREVCAFLGEAALLSHAGRRHAAQHAGLVHAWRRDSHRYFGMQSERLRAALATPAAPYIYAWNYPVARYLALRVAGRYLPDRIWRIFAGQMTVRDMLLDLA